MKNKPSPMKWLIPPILTGTKKESMNYLVAIVNGITAKQKENPDDLRKLLVNTGILTEDEIYYIIGEQKDKIKKTKDKKKTLADNSVQHYLCQQLDSEKNNKKWDILHRAIIKHRGFTLEEQIKIKALGVFSAQEFCNVFALSRQESDNISSVQNGFFGFEQEKEALYDFLDQPNSAKITDRWKVLKKWLASYKVKTPIQDLAKEQGDIITAHMTERSFSMEDAKTMFTQLSNESKTNLTDKEKEGFYHALQFLNADADITTRDRFAMAYFLSSNNLWKSFNNKLEALPQKTAMFTPEQEQKILACKDNYKTIINNLASKTSNNLVPIGLRTHSKTTYANASQEGKKALYRFLSTHNLLNSFMKEIDTYYAAKKAQEDKQKNHQQKGLELPSDSDSENNEQTQQRPVGKKPPEIINNMSKLNKDSDSDASSPRLLDKKGDFGMDQLELLSDSDSENNEQTLRLKQPNKPPQTNKRSFIEADDRKKERKLNKDPQNKPNQDPQNQPPVINLEQPPQVERFTAKENEAIIAAINSSREAIWETLEKHINDHSTQNPQTADDRENLYDRLGAYHLIDSFQRDDVYQRLKRHGLLEIFREEISIATQIKANQSNILNMPPKVIDLGKAPVNKKADKKAKKDVGTTQQLRRFVHLWDNRRQDLLTKCFGYHKEQDLAPKYVIVKEYLRELERNPNLTISEYVIKNYPAETIQDFDKLASNIKEAWDTLKLNKDREGINRKAIVQKMMQHLDNTYTKKQVEAATENYVKKLMPLQDPTEDTWKQDQPIISLEEDVLLDIPANKKKKQKTLCTLNINIRDKNGASTTVKQLKTEKIEIYDKKDGDAKKLPYYYRVVGTKYCLGSNDAPGSGIMYRTKGFGKTFSTPRWIDTHDHLAQILQDITKAQISATDKLQNAAQRLAVGAKTIGNAFLSGVKAVGNTAGQGVRLLGEGAKIVGKTLTIPFEEYLKNRKQNPQIQPAPEPEPKEDIVTFNTDIRLTGAEAFVNPCDKTIIRNHNNIITNNVSNQINDLFRTRNAEILYIERQKGEYEKINNTYNALHEATKKVLDENLKKTDPAIEQEISTVEAFMLKLGENGKQIPDNTKPKITNHFINYKLSQNKDQIYPVELDKIMKDTINNSIAFNILKEKDPKAEQKLGKLKCVINAALISDKPHALKNLYQEIITECVNRNIKEIAIPLIPSSKDKNIPDEDVESATALGTAIGEAKAQYSKEEMPKIHICSYNAAGHRLSEKDNNVKNYQFPEQIKTIITKQIAKTEQMIKEEDEEKLAPAPEPEPKEQKSEVLPLKQLVINKSENKGDESKDQQLDKSQVPLNQSVINKPENKGDKSGNLLKQSKVFGGEGDESENKGERSEDENDKLQVFGGENDKSGNPLKQSVIKKPENKGDESGVFEGLGGGENDKSGNPLKQSVIKKPENKGDESGVFGGEGDEFSFKVRQSQVFGGEGGESENKGERSEDENDKLQVFEGLGGGENDKSGNPLKQSVIKKPENKGDESGVFGGEGDEFSFKVRQSQVFGGEGGESENKGERSEDENDKLQVFEGLGGGENDKSGNLLKQSVINKPENKDDKSGNLLKQSVINKPENKDDKSGNPLNQSKDPLNQSVIKKPENKGGESGDLLNQQLDEPRVPLNQSVIKKSVDKDNESENKGDKLQVLRQNDEPRNKGGESIVLLPKDESGTNSEGSEDENDKSQVFEGLGGDENDKSQVFEGLGGGENDKSGNPLKQSVIKKPENKGDESGVFEGLGGDENDKSGSESGDKSGDESGSESGDEDNESENKDNKSGNPLNQSVIKKLGSEGNESRSESENEMDISFVPRRKPKNLEEKPDINKLNKKQTRKQQKLKTMQDLQHAIEGLTDAVKHMNRNIDSLEERDASRFNILEQKNKLEKQLQEIQQTVNAMQQRNLLDDKDQPQRLQDFGTTINRPTGAITFSNKQEPFAKSPILKSQLFMKPNDNNDKDQQLSLNPKQFPYGGGPNYDSKQRYQHYYQQNSNIDPNITSMYDTKKQPSLSTKNCNTQQEQRLVTILNKIKSMSITDLSKTIDVKTDSIIHELIKAGYQNGRTKDHIFETLTPEQIINIFTDAKKNQGYAAVNKNDYVMQRLFSIAFAKLYQKEKGANHNLRTKGFFEAFGQDRGKELVQENWSDLGSGFIPHSRDRLLSMRDTYANLEGRGGSF